MKLLKIGVICVGVYFVLVVLFGALVGYYQPQDSDTVVVRTLDSQGQVQETVIRIVVGEDGSLWLLSGLWFRGWYNRALDNSEIELIRNGQMARYRVKAITDSKTIETVDLWSRDGKSARTWWVGRALLLFAPPKVLALELRQNSE